MKTKVQVKDLMEGDKLSSGAEIMIGPIQGLTIPSGKVEVSVRYGDGKTKIQRWGKYTTVTITNR